MKLNFKTFKVLFALLIVIGVIYWAVSSVIPQTYSGTDLEFGMGGGPVSITNSSDQAVAAQMTSNGSRTFSISSTIDGVSGSSTRQGSGTTSTQLFELAIPPGTNEVTVTRGTDIHFLANDTTGLQVTVNPMTSDNVRSTLIFAVVVILAALFYASNVTNHQWLRMMRGKDTAVPVATTTPEAVVSGGQGREMRAYGDNRAQR